MLTRRFALACYALFLGASLLGFACPTIACAEEAPCITQASDDQVAVDGEEAPILESGKLGDTLPAAVDMQPSGSEGAGDSQVREDDVLERGAASRVDDGVATSSDERSVGQGGQVASGPCEPTEPQLEEDCLAPAGVEATGGEAEGESSGANASDRAVAPAQQASMPVVKPAGDTVLKAQASGSSQTNASSITSTIVVTMAPKTKAEKVADVSHASKAENANVGLYSANSLAHQRFRIERIANSAFCRIVSVNSGKALSVLGAISSGARVVQKAVSGARAQQWLVKLVSGINYEIRTSATNKVLYLGFDKKTGRLQLIASSRRDDGTWALANTRTIADGVYVINSGVAKNRSLDISGCSLSAGANAISYQSNGSNAQRFVVEYDIRTGYYSISNVASGMTLDLVRSSKKNGGNVTQWTSRGAANQQWSIERCAGTGAYCIVSRVSGMALDVCRRSAKSGANVCQWTRTGNANQRWSLAAVSSFADGCYTVAAFANRSFALDVKNGSYDTFSNVQIWRSTGSAAQVFEIVEYASKLHTIRNRASGLYLSVARGSSVSGANVDVEGGTVIDKGKLWQIKPMRGGIVFISATGLALDIKGAAIANGTNAHAYTRNDSKAQRFVVSCKGVATVGVTQIEAELPSTASAGSVCVQSLMRGGTPTLVLPSDAPVGSLRLRYGPTRQRAMTEVAKTRTGSYSSLAQGASVNLSSYSVNASGAYELWLRTRGTGDARLVCVTVSKTLTIEDVARHVIAHRGASMERAEHTIEAYDLALLQGAEQIEPDVVSSSDGVLYVSHDLSAKRLTGVDKTFETMSHEQIDALRTCDGDKILRLSEVFDRYGSTVRYVPELKGIGRVVDSFIDFLSSLVGSYRMTVQSSAEFVLERFANLGVERLLGASDQAMFDEACATSCADIIMVNKSLMNATNCAKAHEASKRFCVWTLDTESEIRTAISLGVDLYFTDCTAKAIALELAYRG